MIPENRTAGVAPVSGDPSCPADSTPAGGEQLAPGRTVSIVIPAYNESRRIERTFDEIRPWLDAHLTARYEVLVVDDGSRDETAAIVEKYAGGSAFQAEVKHDRGLETRTTSGWPQLRLLRQPRNLGKGAAVRRGCLAAAMDYVLFMDADHATPIDELRAFLPKIEQGYDMVAGVRTFQEHESRSRRIMGLGLLMLAHAWVFQKAVVDSQCGFKLFRREACQKLFSRCRIDGGMIDVELFCIAHLLGDVRIWYSPVHWDNKAGSTINVWRCVMFDPLDLLAIRWRRMRGVYQKPMLKQPWETARHEIRISKSETIAKSE